MSITKGLLVLAAVAAWITPATATTVTVTDPAGVFTNPGPSNSGDPFAFGQWLRANVRNDGSVGITTDNPRSGNGSAWLAGTQGPGGASSKADFEYFFPVADLAVTTLGNLSALSYEWYRDSASTAAAHLHPALRIYFDADGNFATTGDRGYLVYERAYNPNTAAVPTNTWQTDDVFNFNGAGQSANLWMVNFGNPNGSVLEIFDRDLGDWLTTPNPNAAYPTLSASTVVYGLSFGIGSGWGPFEGSVDNVTIGFNDQSTTYNFEVVPEPGSLILLGTGLIGLATWGRKYLKR